MRTQLYTEQKKFKARMNYADKLGVPFVVFLGEDEVREGLVSCKDMASGEQRKGPLQEILAWIRETLARQSAGAIIRE